MESKVKVIGGLLLLFFMEAKSSYSENTDIKKKEKAKLI